MKASDIMTSKPTVITPDEPLREAAILMEYGEFGMVPVVESTDSMKPAGVITDRDIAVRHVAHCHRDDCTVRDHMTTGHLVTVRSDDHAHDVIGRLQHDHVRRALVVDAQHRLVGVIAQADIARVVGQQEPKLVEHMLQTISEPVAVTA